MREELWTRLFGIETSPGLVRLRREWAEAGDAVAFARDKLGFDPDEKQMAMLRGGKQMFSAPSEKAAIEKSRPV